MANAQRADDVSAAGTRPLPLLADAAGYRPCTWDLTGGGARCDYWLGLFRDHFAGLLRAAVAEEADRGLDRADAERRAREAERDLGARLDRWAVAPDADGHLDILTLCRAREAVLAAHGFGDPYRLEKERENAQALERLPGVLAELDAEPAASRMAAAVEGVFAGNIFDLGATRTAERFRHEAVDFARSRAELAARPWHVDALDAWLRDLAERGPPRWALLFVDNAGCDVVLGMLPLARELLRRGSGVILAANSTPSLNDITAAELADVLERARGVDAELDAARAEQRLELVATGTGEPLIDLGAVAEPLAQKADQRDVDLLVLEGMGRALESNFAARFACDAIKMAMIKDPGVAEQMEGELYDLVFAYEPAFPGGNGG